jgi:hypothetical protein
MMTIDLQATVAQIRQTPGVIGANAWTRVPGKERIYVDLEKLNGGRNWNGGIGHRVVVDLNDGSVKLDTQYGRTWAGGATRDFHTENDTLGKIAAVVRQ